MQPVILLFWERLRAGSVPDFLDQNRPSAAANTIPARQTAY